MTDNKPPSNDPTTRLLETLRSADVKPDGIVTLEEYKQSKVGQTIAIHATAQPLTTIDTLLKEHKSDPSKTITVETLKVSAIDKISQERESVSAILSKLNTENTVRIDTMLLGEKSDKPLSMTVEAAKQFISDYTDGLGRAINAIEKMPAELLNKRLNSVTATYYDASGHKTNTAIEPITPPTTHLAKSQIRLPQK